MYVLSIIYPGTKVVEENQRAQHVRRVPEAKKTRRILISRQHRHVDAIVAKRLSSASTYTTQKQRRPSTKVLRTKAKAKTRKNSTNAWCWPKNMQLSCSSGIPPEKSRWKGYLTIFTIMQRNAILREKTAFPLDDTFEQCGKRNKHRQRQHNRLARVSHLSSTKWRGNAK